MADLPGESALVNLSLSPLKAAVPTKLYLLQGTQRGWAGWRWVRALPTLDIHQTGTHLGLLLMCLSHSYFRCVCLNAGQPQRCMIKEWKENRLNEY